MASNIRMSQMSSSGDADSESALPLPPSRVARRTHSGRYVHGVTITEAGSADLSSELAAAAGGGNYAEYRVHIPATPDNQPMDPSIAARVEVQYVSNSIFSGGINSVTRAHLMDRVTDTAAVHPQMAGVKGSTCQVPGCNSKLMSDARGNDILPCDCGFKICADCFHDAAANAAVCPGCKEPYSNADEQKKLMNYHQSVTPAGAAEWDHNKWLYETKGTYGYGNAIWPTSDDSGGGGGSGGSSTSLGELSNKPFRPLTRKTKITAAIISPYRLIILLRFVALGFFLAWRVTNVNRDAPWLWGMSVVCEFWFAFSWLLDQLPKLNPVNRSADLAVLSEKFDSVSAANPTGKSDLPGLDIFVSTADPEKEPVLVTANTILSILAADYPVEKLSCYVSDDGGALVTFEAMAEAASFANLWVPFCRKHGIEPRNPESYFGLKTDPFKGKVRADFVRDRRRMKREYDEFKVRINGLPDAIRRRSDAFNTREEIKAARLQREQIIMENDSEQLPQAAKKIPKATWMADGSHWPGTWMAPSSEHSRGDHAGIIQVMLKPPSEEPLLGRSEDDDVMADPEEMMRMKGMELSAVDIRLPMLVYVSREKRPGYDHNKKAGAMNALVRASAVMSNGAFLLNLDCDHYVYNSKAFREGMCFMMDRGGDRLAYVQFPQRFEGIDPSDRYANNNTVFFDVNMRALDGLMGPMYVGTGCLFRRIALYSFDPPRSREYRHTACCACCFPRRRRIAAAAAELEARPLRDDDEREEAVMANLPAPKKFGSSKMLLESIPTAEYQGRPLADHPAVKNGRAPGALRVGRELLDATRVAEAISVISCWYEERTEWGRGVGWIYGSVTEDVVTGYRMHNRGWKSAYCVTRPDAFRGTAPINLTDRLHQVLRWATGSVEIFFSRNNALLASPKMKLLQRIAYLNVGIYPFTSIFLIVYCFLPALSLFSGQFIVQTLSVTFLVFLLVITLSLCALAVLEVKWSGISLEEWWRNEQFWVIGGTSAHLVAVMQGILKVVAGIDISFTLTSKSAGGEEEEDEFAELYLVKWTSLMIPPLVIIMVNVIAIAVGVGRTVYSVVPEWSKLLGGVFFAVWVLAHLYPFAKGLMGRRGKTPTIIFIWSGLIAITISLLWVAIAGTNNSQLPSGFSFP